MYQPSITWNENVRLIISDVDETIAPVYEPVSPEMAAELTTTLEEGIKFVLVSGGSLSQINRRVIDYLPSSLRHGIIIGHCNGAETWGYEETGELRREPFYSAYENFLTDNQKNSWRRITRQILAEFGLRPHDPRPIGKFTDEIGMHPLDIMYEDRGPQITLEMINSYDLAPEEMELLKKTLPEAPIDDSNDLRHAVVSRANESYWQNGIPITARLGGVFAVDLAISGITKATAVQHTLDNPEVLRSIGLSRDDLKDSSNIEIWGDKFAKSNGGADSYMSEAVDPNVRSIDFRIEDPKEFSPNRNIVLWDGYYHLQDGLLEYLQTRHNI